jgi:transcriptional regulator with XRE-family HTH domain
MPALRFFGNLTQAQIAAEFNVSQMQVSRLLARGLTWLRAAMLSAAPPPWIAGENVHYPDGTVAEARAALAAHQPEPPISEQLLPTWGEAHRACDLTTEASLRSDLPRLVGRSAHSGGGCRPGRRQDGLGSFAQATGLTPHCHAPKCARR